MAAPGTLPCPADWVERRSSQTYRYRKRSRTVSVRAEDAYLRVDVACGVEGCPCCPPTAPAVPEHVPHLLLPDTASLGTFLEIFELPEVQGLVLLTSVMRQLHQGGNMRRSSRLRALYMDKRRGNHLFDNLHQLKTAPRSQVEVRQGLDLLAAAEWYYQHLGCRLPVVVLSDRLAGQLGQGQQASSSNSSSGGGSVGLDARKQTAGGGRTLSAAAKPPQPAATAGSLAGGAGDEDAELEALLRHMDVGGHSGAAAASALGVMLEGLFLGDQAAPSAGSAAAAAAAADRQAPFPPWQQQQQQAGSAAALQPGVHIMSAADYFGGAAGIAHPPAVLDIFDSISQPEAEQDEAEAKQEGSAGGPASGSSAGFAPHLSQAAIDAGLQAGSLLQGTLSVSRRNPQEATVRIGGGELGGAGRQVLISGRGAINRAVHGDTVAVRLLPREHWRPLAAVASEAAAGEDEADLLATAGGGDGAEVAVDEAAEPGAAGVAAGSDAELDAVAELFRGAAADALLPAAEVVGVLQRSGAEIVACLAEEDEKALAAKQESSRQESVLAVPTDRRVPKLRLRSRQLHRLLGQRLVLRLDGWDRGSSFPHGHVVRVLGPINDLKAETDGVLAASGVQWQPFSEAALRELPPIASSAEYRIPAEQLAARRDLRSPDYLICSIDPPGCTDVDDALSVRWLGPQPSSSSSGGGSSASSGVGGGSSRELVEVGVHIADVSFFVRQGGLLDSEAAARCTTVYLVDRRLDMLPALLSEDLCSLRGGVDRYAVSVLWTLDAETLEVQSVWFGRTLIRSRYQLEYSQAQAIMDGTAVPPQPGQVDVSPADRPALQRNLAFLARLAAHRRQRRLEAGALELESAELRFKTDASGQPTDVLVKQELPMMRIVAEMMIFANSAVAERIATTFPRAALLRRHPPPRREAFEEVQQLCMALLPEAAGLDLEADPATLAASLAAACAAAPPALAALIKSLTTRAMSEAEYFSTGDVTGRGGGGMSHYGLALQHYTHFTSPIRRYADIVVHRQLLAAVAGGGHEGMGPQAAGTEVPRLQPASSPATAGAGTLVSVQPPLPSAELSAKAAVMNERHRTAKRAQKDCSDLYLLLLLHAKPHVEAATIYGFRGTALLVFVARYHLRGVIHLTDQDGVCRPPLRGPEDADHSDPYVLAYRRELIVGEEGRQLCIRRQADGAEVATFRLKQRVWVELSAEGSRAHGPALRIRLLADSHPAAVEAARQAGAAGADEAVGPGAEQGCGALPRAAQQRAYRPPGIGSNSSQPLLQAKQGPPPGIEQPVGLQARASASQPESQEMGYEQRRQQQQWQRQEAPPASLAQALAAALKEAQADEVQGQLQLDHGPAERSVGSAEEVPLPSVARLAPPVLHSLTLLEQRTSRAAVLSACSAPGDLRARERAAKALLCREQLLQLRQWLLAVK